MRDFLQRLELEVRYGELPSAIAFALSLAALFYFGSWWAFL